MHGCYFVFFPRLVCRMSTEEIKRKRLSVLAATICVAGVGVSAGLAAALLIFFRCYGCTKLGSQTLCKTTWKKGKVFTTEVCFSDCTQLSGCALLLQAVKSLAYLAR